MLINEARLFEWVQQQGAYEPEYRRLRKEAPKLNEGSAGVPVIRSDLSAAEEYLTAPLEERGLFLSMSVYCWVNRSIPNDLDKMAAMIRGPS